MTGKKTYNDRPDFPLCTYVARIRDYVLREPSERCLFDWLITSSINFGYTDFVHSIPEIESELGIKRTQQERILAKFVEIGFLTIGKKLYKDKPYKSFLVNFSGLAKEDTLAQVIRCDSPNFKTFKEFFSFHARKQSKTDVPTKAEQKKEIDLMEIAKGIHEGLIGIYNERREMYNKGKLGDQRGIVPLRAKTATRLPFDNKIAKKLYGLYIFANKDKQSIMDSFLVLTDHSLIGLKLKTNILAYFLTYNDLEGSYSVYNEYLNRFNNNYSTENNYEPKGPF